MTEYEAYQEHIRYTHDTYCRIVIRHAYAGSEVETGNLP